MRTQFPGNSRLPQPWMQGPDSLTGGCRPKPSAGLWRPKMKPRLVAAKDNSLWRFNGPQRRCRGSLWGELSDEESGDQTQRRKVCTSNTDLTTSQPGWLFYQRNWIVTKAHVDFLDLWGFFLIKMRFLYKNLLCSLYASAWLGWEGKFSALCDTGMQRLNFTVGTSFSTT